jgi:hypothetical protein
MTIDFSGVGSSCPVFNRHHASTLVIFPSDSRMPAEAMSSPTRRFRISSRQHRTRWGAHHAADSRITPNTLRRPHPSRPAASRRPRPARPGAVRPGDAADGRRRAERRSRPLLRQGETLHPALPLRGAQPARNLRSQTRRPVRRPQSVPAHRHERAQRAHLRTPAAYCPGSGPLHPRAVDDTSVQHPLRRLRPVRHPDHRHSDGAEPARQPALAVLRLRPRLFTLPQGAEIRSAVQRRPAVEVQHAGRAVPPRWALRRLPRQRLRSGLGRVPPRSQTLFGNG